MHFAVKLATACALTAALSACAQTRDFLGLENSAPAIASAPKTQSAEPAQTAQARKSAGAFSFASAGADDSLTPPNAKPGECYARVTQEAQFRTITEKVEAQAASEVVRTIPATYKTLSERVVVEEASERLVVVPATYKTVTETVIVEPESTRVITVPAKYETRTERVKVADAYTTWKRGGNIIAYGAADGENVLQTATSPNGEVMCLVEVPAQYETISKRVQVAPATTRTEVIPAKTRTITKRVVDQPATTRTQAIPAKYATITKRVVDQPARSESVPVPASYKTITRREMTAPAKTVWASVLCDVNATPANITELQRALAKRGHYKGPIDGIYGPMTSRAVNAYQRSKGVSRGPLTMQSAKELGLNI